MTFSAWKRQLQWLGGYFTFYNPLNALRALRKDGSPLRWYRFGYQIVGLLGALRTAWKTLPYALRLIVSKPTYHPVAPPITKVPVRQVSGSFSRFPVGLKPESLLGHGLLTVPPAPTEGLPSSARGDLRSSAGARSGDRAPTTPVRTAA